MITEKDVQQAERNVQNYLSENLLTKKPEQPRFVPFYISNAKMSLLIAQHLHNLSIDPSLKKQNNFPSDFECFLWVVVTSYYSMFYTANAALAKIGLKVGEKIAHKITQDCLLAYFIKNNRIAKTMLEEYKEAKNEVLTVMGLNEEELLKEFKIKANELIASFDYQRKKRGEFQYDITLSAKQHVAQLSLNRAQKFIQEMNKIIEKIQK